MVVGLEPAEDPLEPTGVSRVQEALWANLPPDSISRHYANCGRSVAGRRLIVSETPYPRLP